MLKPNDHDLLVRIDVRTARMEQEQNIIRKYVPTWCERCKTRWLLLTPVVMAIIGLGIKAAFY